MLQQGFVHASSPPTRHDVTQATVSCHVHACIQNTHHPHPPHPPSKDKVEVSSDITNTMLPEFLKVARPEWSKVCETQPNVCNHVWMWHAATVRGVLHAAWLSF